MALERQLIDAERMRLTLQRMAMEVLENHPGLHNLCLIGIQPRGVPLAFRMQQLLQSQEPGLAVPAGTLDVTFHRDDILRRAEPLIPKSTDVPFSLEGKHILLTDDVLYTGRTVRAALDALLQFGRPRNVELLVLVDRIRRREVPIEARYYGIKIDTLDSERVTVDWQELQGQDSVQIAARS